MYSVNSFRPTYMFYLHHPSATIPTHTVAQFTTLRRRRRDTEDESISLSLSLFNDTHSFRVSRNTGVLSPNYVLEEVGPDGVPRPVQSSLGDCYFAQEMRDEEMVTVTICDDEIVSCSDEIVRCDDEIVSCDFEIGSCDDEITSHDDEIVG